MSRRFSCILETIRLALRGAVTSARTVTGNFTGVNRARHISECFRMIPRAARCFSQKTSAAGRKSSRMTIVDDGKFCGRCAAIGLQRLAHRIMQSKGKPKRCDEHFREEWGLPQLTEDARQFIARCKEREHEAAEKSAPVHEEDRNAIEVSAGETSRSPTVRELLGAFRNPVRDRNVPDAAVRAPRHQKSRRESLPAAQESNSDPARRDADGTLRRSRSGVAPC